MTPLFRLLAASLVAAAPAFTFAQTAPIKPDGSLRYALGGPLGVLVTAATAASLVAYFIKNKNEIQSKMGRFRERIEEQRAIGKNPVRLAPERIKGLEMPFST